MKRLLIGLVMLMLLATFASAQGGESDLALDPEMDPDVTTDPNMVIIKTKLKKIINMLQYIAGFIAAIAAVITGIMFMSARDPSEKRQVGDRLKSIIIGLVIVVLSIPIVNLIIT